MSQLSSKSPAPEAPTQTLPDFSTPMMQQYAIKAIPAYLKGRDPQDAVLDTLEQLPTKDESVDIQSTKH